VLNLHRRTSGHQMTVAATFQQVNGELQQLRRAAARRADERVGGGTPGDTGASGVRLRRVPGPDTRRLFSST